MFQNPLTSTQALLELEVNGDGDFSTWAKALDEGGPSMTPNLEHLFVKGVEMYGDGYTHLGNKFKRGDWQKLQQVVMYGDMMNADLISLAKSMQDSPHRYTSLQVLTLECNFFGLPGVQALADMLKEGTCPQLKECVTTIMLVTPV